MPSTSKKQSRFMQAVAHSPSFAKKVGVSQSVGKDFSSADKGRKFADGGNVDWDKRAAAAREDARRSQSDEPTPAQRAEMERAKQEAKQKIQEDKAPTTRTTMPKFASGGFLKTKINKQDTKHGKMDMPFTSLTRFAGMKKGGNVKRYDDGGGVTEGQNPNIDDDTRARALAWVKKQQEGGSDESAPAPVRKTAPAPVRKAAPVAPKPVVADEKDFGAVNEDESRNSKAVTGRTYKRPAMLKMDSPEYEKNRQLLGETALGMASLHPIGRAVGAGRVALADRARRAEQLSSMAERKAMLANRRKETAYDARRASDMEAMYKKGGNVKESKAMVGKEMMFMKKKGAPASMIKHEKAEMGMAKGGMAKDTNMNPKGSTFGSSRAGENTKIQKRGLTEGRVIKMAAGGSVGSASRRADGIAQRGKTRC